MGFSASNFSASTPWLVIIMLDLDFFGWMYLGFLLLPNCLERVKISKTSIENLVYGWPLTLCIPFCRFFLPLRVERLEMTCFNLSGFYWVQTIIERDSCAITYYWGVEWQKMSGVKNIIFRCYILLFSTDGWGGLMYFSISLHILCEVPRSFSPNSYSAF